jgi:hypothetical protein
MEAVVEDEVQRQFHRVDHTCLHPAVGLGERQWHRARTHCTPELVVNGHAGGHANLDAACFLGFGEPPLAHGVACALLPVGGQNFNAGLRPVFVEQVLADRTREHAFHVLTVFPQVVHVQDVELFQLAGRQWCADTCHLERAVGHAVL